MEFQLGLCSSVSTARKVIRTTSLNHENPRRKNAKRWHSRTGKKNNANTRKRGRDYLAVRPLRLPAHRRQEVRHRPARTRQQTAGERARVVVAETTRSEILQQLQISPGIFMIRRLLPGRTDRNYKDESARGALRSSLLRNSRLGTLVVRMGVEGVALDLATEAREQAKGILYRILITSPVLTPATSGESEGIPFFLPI